MNIQTKKLLLALTCILPLTCLANTNPTYIAVGTRDLVHPYMLTSQNNGTSWQAMNRPNSIGFYNHVTCADKTCVAVGLLKQTTGGKVTSAPLIDVSFDAGISWRPLSFPSAPINSQLKKISCLNSNGKIFCLAVGDIKDGEQTKPFMMKTDDARTWARNTFNDSIQGTLNNVSCQSQNGKPFCITVGELNSLPLITTFSTESNSAKFTVPFNGKLNNVSCAGNNCLASGDSNSRVLVVTSADAGHHWETSITTQIDGNINKYELECNKNKNCMLVGSYKDKDVIKPLVATSNDYGVTWTSNIAAKLPKNVLPLHITYGINNNAIVSGYVRTGNTQSHVILQSTDQGNTWNVINNSLAHMGKIVGFITNNEILFLQFGIDKKTLKGQLSASMDGKVWHTALFPQYTYISSITKV